MKVLLISPLTQTYRCRWTPLAPCYLSAVLKRGGHEVRFFDRTAQLARWRDREAVDRAMEAVVAQWGPDLIGLTTNSPAIADTVTTVQCLRRQFNDLLVAGGHHATALPELTLQRLPELDGVIVGNGEESFLQVADGGSLQSIPGLAVRSERDSVKVTPPRPLQDLDCLPQPDYDILDLPYYCKRNTATMRGFWLSSLSFLSSRGCERRCSFCSESLNYSRGVAFHSPDYVAEGLQRLANRYGVEGVYFHDNDFLADRDRAEAICQRLHHSKLHRRLRWIVQTRADRLDRELLRLLKSAGCIKIELGLEACDQGVLDHLDKGLQRSKIEETLRLCRQERMPVHGYFLTAVPGETETDLAARLAWLKGQPLDTCQWTPLALYPGTVLYEERGRRFFEESDWSVEAVANFYRDNRCGGVPVEARKDWEGRHLQPYLRKLHRRSLWRHCSWLQLFRLICEKYGPLGTKG